MTELLSELQKVGDQSVNVAFIDLALALVLSFALSLAIASLYRHTHKGAGYSQQYVHTLVMMGTIVSLVMLVIGSNIARAFALVGALSIIRFRNAVKETRDVGFIFLAMAIGMAVGTRFFFLAVVATFALSLFILLMSRLNWFARVHRYRTLTIRLPVEQDHDAALSSVFEQHLEHHHLLSLETTRAGELQQASYSVILKPSSSARDLLQAIRQCNMNNKVTLVWASESPEV